MTNFNELKVSAKFMAIADMVQDEEVKAFLKERAEMAEKRNAYKSSKPTAKQLENEQIKTQIMEVLLNAEKPLQCKDIGAVLGFSPSKISALIRQMDGIHKDEVKRVSFFSLA